MNKDELLENHIGKHFIINKDINEKLKKNYSCILIGIPSKQFPTARIYCNADSHDIDPSTLDEAHEIKRFMLFGMLNKGGWNDYKGSFDLVEEALKSLGLYKIGGHKYQIIDRYTGNPIYE